MSHVTCLRLTSGAETHQDGLSVREVEGRLERSQEASRDDVLVDEVGETPPSRPSSCRAQQGQEDTGSEQPVVIKQCVQMFSPHSSTSLERTMKQVF